MDLLFSILLLFLIPTGTLYLFSYCKSFEILSKSGRDKTLTLEEKSCFVDIYRYA